MLVYITTFTLLAILASLPMMLGWLVLLPLVFTSLYASYRNIFPPEKTGAPPVQSSEFTPGANTF